MRKTKIVATLGPACNDIEVIKSLISAGMNAARINFSHGTHESHEEIINKLKQAREELNAPIAMILDTKGPEIRIKTFDTDNIYLAQGSTFTITTEDIVGDVNRVSITYKDLPKDVREGGRILIDDGLIELKVNKITTTDIECIVVNSGFLSSNKGVNIPDFYVNLPSLTQKDIDDIMFGIKMGFDYIAASFVRSANDVLDIRKVLEANNGDKIRIIAKIESREGVDNLDSILEIADGIMVARGDLGVEIPPEEVPLVQKLIIRKSNVKGRPVITATQMLDSMVNNPRPTRAEANDVANAIFDGTDAIMLSGETAKGKYPVESVTMMARIAATTETSIDYNKDLIKHRRSFMPNLTNAMGFAACTMSADLDATCIITVTDSGFTPRMVSKFRPSCPILAVTADECCYRQLNLTWGCIPKMETEINDNNDVFDLAVKKALETGLAYDGDTVVIAAGVPVGESVTTNTLKVQIVGNVKAKGRGIGDKVVTGYANVVKVIEEAEKYFKSGDILVTTFTNNAMMPYIKKAAAIVVGSWEKVDNSHAEIVAEALDIPVIICDANVVDLIQDGIPITVDSKKGFVYNGFRHEA